ncbi:MAG: hypothetical protein ABIO19_16270 [Burkholderiaceae bacterium]
MDAVQPGSRDFLYCYRYQYHQHGIASIALAQRAALHEMQKSAGISRLPLVSGCQSGTDVDRSSIGRRSVINRS